METIPAMTLGETGLGAAGTAGVGVLCSKSLPQSVLFAGSALDGFLSVGRSGLDDSPASLMRSVLSFHACASLACFSWASNV